MEPRSNHTTLIEFKSFVARNIDKGTDLNGTQKEFIFLNHLKIWWSQHLHKVLSEVFGELVAARRRQKIILEIHTKLLSILAYISRLDLLEIVVNSINDYNLPLRSNIHPFNDDVWQAFEQAQWMFCPIGLGPKELSDDDTLDPRSILPGLETTPPDTMEELRVQRRGAHASAFQLFKMIREPGMSDTTTGTKFLAVIKTYPPEGKDAYQREADFFTLYKKSTRPSANIINRLTSFKTHASEHGELLGHLVLEFADRGSLLHYYRNTDRPTTAKERQTFWKSFLQILLGLAHIHESPLGGSLHGGVHQDLKPANILISSGVNGPHSFIPKLCDFGLCSSKIYPGEQSRYREGTSTFFAPERMLSNCVEFSSSKSADCWGVACIILEAAFWVRNGETGRNEFASRRRGAIREQNGELYSRGSRDCFHDGSKALRCVENALDDLDPDDGLTTSIVKIVLETILMQTNPDNRASAETLHGELSVAISKHQGRTGANFDAPHTQQGGGGSPRIPLEMDEVIGLDHANSQHTRFSTLGSPTTKRATAPSMQSTTPDAFTNASPPQRTRCSSFSTANTLHEDGSPSHYRSQRRLPINQDQTRTPLGLKRGVSGSRPFASPRMESGSQFLNTASLGLGDEQLGDAQHRSTLEKGVSTKPSTTSRSPIPDISFDQVSIARKNKMRLPGHDEAQLYLAGRDHIFVVHVSKSMEQHQSTVLNRLPYLVWLVKNFDPDDVEVMLTSDNEIRSFKNASEVEKYVLARFARGMNSYCAMDQTLSKLFEHIKTQLADGKPRSMLQTLLGKERPKARPVSVHILTDGTWADQYQGPDYATLKNQFESLRTFVHHTRGKACGWVSVNFIRLGHYQLGIDILNRLDNKLLPQSEDFIDHKHIEDPVWNMLIGAILPSNDNDQDEGSSRAGSSRDGSLGIRMHQPNF